jgi:hypothetical protein
MATRRVSKSWWTAVVQGQMIPSKKGIWSWRQKASVGWVRQERPRLQRSERVNIEDYNYKDIDLLMDSLPLNRLEICWKGEYGVHALNTPLAKIVVWGCQTKSSNARLSIKLANLHTCSPWSDKPPPLSDCLLQHVRSGGQRSCKHSRVPSQLLM